MLKVGSMFAGIGGFDLGFQKAGFDISWSIEINPHCQKVLKKQFPNSKIYTDISKVQVEDLEKVDVICGGFPCQDLSVAGKRKGLAGERSGLFYEAMRLIRGINPKLVILENVPGLLSSNSGRDFAELLSQMDKGWDCQEIAWRVLDSQFFGVAQRRKRIFIVASSRVGGAEQVLALGESVSGDNKPSKEKRKDLTKNITGDPDKAVWWDGGDRADCLTTCSLSKQQLEPDKRRMSAVIEPIPYDLFQITAPINKQSREPGDPCHTLASSNAVHAAICVDESNTSDPKVMAVRTAQTGANGIGVSEDISHTLDLANGQAIAHNLTIRRLTPIECERLQGFPDDWTAGQVDTNRYRQLGNAVTVNVIEWLANNTKSYLNTINEK